MFIMLVSPLGSLVFLARASLSESLVKKFCPLFKRIVPRVIETYGTIYRPNQPGYTVSIKPMA